MIFWKVFPESAASRRQAIWKWLARPSKAWFARVLLDEMLDRRLRRLLPGGVEALTVRERGWGSLQNSDLLEAAQHEFDVLLTTDRGIPHQQNLERFDLAVVVLSAKSNALADHEPLMPEVSRFLRAEPPELRSGHAVTVGGEVG